MQKTRVELNVFHDGQFFTAVFEETSEERCRAARLVFAQKPSDRTIERIVCENYYKLDFSLPVEAGVLRPLSRNPKRRQRQAAKAKTGVSTKAQAAMQKQMEKRKTTGAKKRSADKKEDQRKKYEMRRQKRKEKHKGH